ncbi:MAG: N-acetyltransferase [Alphaproteobacteria bacterium]|nr:N-acetyltransferase [Alphaproteobacteria bacterium]
MTRQIATRFSFRSIERLAAPVDPHFQIALEKDQDIEARESLLDRVFGPERFQKTSEKLRVNQAPVSGLALVAKTTSGALLGTIRLWPIFAGQGRAALLLGPLAVCPEAKDGGVGRALMLQALARAKAQGHASILLVGDAAYYNRFGFERRFTDRLLLPGPVDRKRFLGRELIPGALFGAVGAVKPVRRQRFTAIAA